MRQIVKQFPITLTTPKALYFVWESIARKSSVLYETNAAPHMIKSNQTLSPLKVCYPKLIHVVYVYGIHKLVDAVEEKYWNVDLFISCIENTLLNAVSQINTFGEMSKFKSFFSAKSTHWCPSTKFANYKNEWNDFPKKKIIKF